MEMGGAPIPPCVPQPNKKTPRWGIFFICIFSDMFPVEKDSKLCHNPIMKPREILPALAVIIGIIGAHGADACTGITLTANDGGVVAARTIEWGESEMENLYTIVPRGYVQQSMLPGGKTGGMTFSSMYGYVGLAVVRPDWVVDGMNEAGLSAGLFYFPGYGEYPPYDANDNANTISDFQLVSWILSRFSTVDQVKSAIKNIRVASIDPRASTAHWRVTEPSGKQIIIEFVDGVANVYDSQLGVLANSPEYPWQLKNLNNYVNLAPGAAGPVKFGPITLRAFGTGSGLLGLPGDFTPPSRFVRAAFLQTYSIKQETTFDAAMQAFHILNNFDVPLGTEFAPGDAPVNMPSATQWTIANDMRNRVIYYHTMYNRTIRELDLSNIDFATIKFQSHPLDATKSETIIPAQIDR